MRVALLYLTTLVLLTALTGKKEVAKSIHAPFNILSIKWSVHPQMEVLPLFTDPYVGLSSYDRSENFWFKNSFPPSDCLWDPNMMKKHWPLQ